MEVERLIAALKSEGKKFEYKIYQDAPDGHEFNRIDTDLAMQSRGGDLQVPGIVLEALAPG